MLSRFGRRLLNAMILLSLAWAPCAAVAGVPEACPMAGCGSESPEAALDRAGCCCEMAPVPTDAGRIQGVVAPVAAPPAAGADQGASLPEPAGTPIPEETGPAVPEPVPLYLLHASLLR